MLAPGISVAMRSTSAKLRITSSGVPGTLNSPSKFIALRRDRMLQHRREVGQAEMDLAERIGDRGRRHPRVDHEQPAMGETLLHRLDDVRFLVEQDAVAAERAR